MFLEFSMKIAVTGANGYLGKGVVKQLLDDGCYVIATDIKTDNIDKRAHIINGNIFDMVNPFEELQKPDVLLHMAWRDGFVHNSVNHINDLPSHASFLRKMIQSGIKRVAVIGSMHEIGFYEGAINENTPCNPESLYGISKNALRRITFLDCKDNGVAFQWLRGFYIVGTSRGGNSIFSKLIKASLEGQKEFPFTTGQNKYDFLDYDIFCKYVALAVEQEKVVGIINICSGHPVKLATRVEQFIKDNHLDIQLQYGKYPDRPYDSKEVWGDNSKLIGIINYEK